VRGGVYVPDAQVGGEQTVPAPGYAPHASPPLHVEAHPPLPGQGVRVPCGAPLTVVHVPFAPVTSHAWHCALHAVSQHTPSTQCPLVQSQSVLQTVPFAFCE
jgi:hypothetical protein